MRFKKTESLAIVLSFCLLIISSVVSAQAETKLSYASPLPDQHQANNVLRSTFEDIKKETNGSLVFQMYTGGTMGGAKEAVQIVDNSTVDSSFIIDVWVKSTLPVSSALSELFAMGDDPMAFAAAMNETQLLDCPECIQEKERHNVIGLAYYSTTPYHLMCKDKVSDLAGLQGKKIRASTRIGALVNYLGGTAVSITTPEIYEALQRGQADCTMGEDLWLESYSLKNVVGSLEQTDIGAYFGALMMDMNLDVWKGLSEGERKVILKNMPKAIAEMVIGGKESGDAAVKAAVAKGMKVYKSDKALADKVAEFRSKEVDTVIEKAKASGVKNADKIIHSFMANVKKWRGLTAKVGNDKKAYADLLWKEIFSKIPTK